MNIKEFIRDIEREVNWILWLFTIIQSLLLAGLFLNRKSLILFLGFSILGIVLNIILKNKRRLIITIVITIIYIPVYINSLIQLNIFLKIMIYIMLLVLVFSYIRVKEIKLDNIKNIVKVLMEFKFKNKSEKENKGDLQVGINQSNKKPVNIPFKDRFVHSLVLGPTGSGKTSQSLIPWLNQDIKNKDFGITVIEPKGDLAEKIYAMAQHYGRKAIYFNPILEACPTFNPLYGPEDDVIEDITTTFKMLNPDSPQFFKDMNEQLLRNALKIFKRLKGNNATLIDLNNLLRDNGGAGKRIINQFEEYNKNRVNNKALESENEEIINYFRQDYYNEKSKTQEHTSGVRSQVDKLVSNKYLRKVLNPENGKSDIRFDEHLNRLYNDGKGEQLIICIATAQGKLRDLGSFLGYFLILSYQSAVLRRDGLEDIRMPHTLVLDESQKYANKGMLDLLNQGRSYRVATVLATQSLSLFEEEAGRGFLETVKTNCRNTFIYPGISSTDAKYYSDEFGEIIKRRVSKGVSKQRFDILQQNKPNAPTDSKTIVEEEKARFSPSDIMYREFGEITIKYIKNNTVQEPVVVNIEFIPWELNKKLDKMVIENNKLMEKGINPYKYRTKKGKLKKPINKILQDNLKLDDVI
ncbi:type IV secretory system conjugative DNA transfer family protein [Dethiothermospora halolimnae]|uniref:type IV secretory system conjugative DNA transfer family protein n=1 Tax=Dethiothermospora halolimnae TaxID=3114390 RepID=UPI003CCC4142